MVHFLFVIYNNKHPHPLWIACKQAIVTPLKNFFFYFFSYLCSIFLKC
nr:MAG TPA: hypothetical protein [Caudoviricetes sp.]